MLKNLLIVGAGGMLGSMLRYTTWLIIKEQPFPYATLLVNIFGSFVIGIIAAAALKNLSFDTNWRLFLATGICGGFTTFSAFSLECVSLFQQQRYMAGLLYIFISVMAGIAAVFAGFYLTTHLILK